MKIPKPIYIEVHDPLQNFKDYLYSKAQNGENCTKEFFDLVYDSIKNFLYEKSNNETLYCVRETIYSQFQYAKSIRAHLSFAEGAIYVGAVPVIKSSTLNILWKTDFYLGPIWTRQSGDVMPLGHYKRYDLYLGFQDPLPPTLIARYGNREDEYATFNPHLADFRFLYIDGHKDTSPLKEAYLRAQSLGWLLND